MLSPQHSPSGQGLLEATIAIGMILLGLGAILTLTLQNVSATAASNEQAVALQLAREGIEVVRGMRDSNWLVADHSDPSRTWDAGLKPSAGECTSTYCGAAVVFTPPAEPQPAAEPASFSLKFIPFSTSRSGFNLSALQLYRGEASEHYLWRQDPTGALVSSYQVTGYYRAVLLDPVCQNGSQPPVVEANRNDGECQAAGETKIGYRVESQVLWPTPGLFGGALRRSLSLVEYIYNWR